MTAAIRGAHERTTTDETLPIAAHCLYAVPDEPSAGGAAPRKDGAEEIRDESGLGSGAGVSASDSGGAGNGENAEGVDIIHGGTDAGGTDFGANMGGPGDTGGIRIEGVTPPVKKADGEKPAADE